MNLSNNIFKSIEVKIGDRVVEKYIKCDKCKKLHADDPFECIIYCDKCKRSHRDEEIECILSKLQKSRNHTPWSGLIGEGKS